jgi:molybdopterin molybdotransferase
MDCRRVCLSRLRQPACGRGLWLAGKLEALEELQLVPNHNSVEAAITWVDAVTQTLDREDVPLRVARERVLAEFVRSQVSIPGGDRAALDGFAVESTASLGASTYSPVALPLIAVVAGDALPAGTDAVIQLDLAEPIGQACIEVVEPVAPGCNVEQQGAIATIGAMLVGAGTRLAACHIGLLACAGLSEVPVVRRPRVRLLVTEPTKSAAAKDSNGPMIRAAVERDGGIIDECIVVERDGMAISSALAQPEADIVLSIGGTGPGNNDRSAAVLAGVGELAIHGLALHPGETTGLGRTGSRVPVVLLPGAPAACLWSYELFAGRAIRRLGGRGGELPYRSRKLVTARKIVSALGMTEIRPVRYGGAAGTIEPMPSFAETGLMAAVDADGFVIVPQESEGYPQGAPVSVYLYENGKFAAELNP